MAKTTKGGVKVVGNDGAATLEPLRGNTNSKTAGDFVHAGQTMASNQDFKNVSKKWFDKTHDYDYAFEMLQRDKRNTEDVIATFDEMTPTVNGADSFVFRYKDGREFIPTEPTLNNLGLWLGNYTTIIKQLLTDPVDQKGRQKFARDRGDMETLTQVVANAKRRLDPDKRYLFRLNLADDTVRCVLSDSYTIIDNVFAMETVAKTIPGGRVSHWTGDFDAMFTNVLIPDTIRIEEDSDFGGMVSLVNSEVGTKRLRLTPSLYRAICQNGLIHGQIEGCSIKQIHKGEIDLDVLRNQMIEVITKQIPLMDSYIDTLVHTKQLGGWDGGNILPLLTVVASDYGFGKPQAVATLEGYRTELNETKIERGTLFSLINGVTRGAHKFQANEWYDMNEAAGRMMTLDADDWDTMKRRARRMKTADVEKYFANAA